MLESNPLYYKKNPCVKISFDLFLFCNFSLIIFFCLGGALRKELLYERNRTAFNLKYLLLIESGDIETTPGLKRSYFTNFLSLEFKWASCFWFCQDVLSKL